MSKHLTPDEITAKLTQPGPALNVAPTDRLPAPNIEMAISLTLDQLRPYDRNPRTHRNPKYDEIKASIRAVGLKQTLTVTQRPGDDKFMISDGGNTRLAILEELYQETQDERFYHFDCHFIPWQGEIHVLAGHLAENDNRGQLAWIERARGVYEAKRMLEEEAGEEISQRELTRRLRELGYTITQSHISRMLYTIEHFLPTLPLSLESGMGRPQIEKLIAYRQICEEIWQRSDTEGDFAEAWHETMGELDYDGQTEFRWNIVEDRLKGMLMDRTGVHMNILDMTWKDWFSCRKYRGDMEKEEVWRALEEELAVMRDPNAAPPQLYPPLPEKKSQQTPSPRISGNDTQASNRLTPPDGHKGEGDDGGEPCFEDGQSDLSPTQTLSPRGVPMAGGTDESVELKEMRAQIAELEARNAELQEQQVTHEHSPSSSDDGLAGVLDVDGLMLERTPSPTRSPEEQATIADDLTLSHYEESEGHRQLRHLMAKEHGEQAVDFEAAALQSVPLMSAGPIAPITDLWHIPAWRRNPRDLRMQIGDLLRGLAEWAGIEASGDSDVIRLNANDGLGYEMGPLDDAQDRRAQLVWQLLAGLQGANDPSLPAEISLLGELVGSHGQAADVRLPDGLLIRVWWLTRLIRVLREELDKEGTPQ